jgi:hypothetical protein
MTKRTNITPFDNHDFNSLAKGSGCDQLHLPITAKTNPASVIAIIDGVTYFSEPMWEESINGDEQFMFHYDPSFFLYPIIYSFDSKKILAFFLHS